MRKYDLQVGDQFKTNTNILYTIASIQDETMKRYPYKLQGKYIDHSSRHRQTFTSFACEEILNRLLKNGTYKLITNGIDRAIRRLEKL